MPGFFSSKDGGLRHVAPALILRFGRSGTAHRFRCVTIGGAVKQGYTPKDKAAFERARAIQSEKRLSLRDLSEALRKEGFNLSIRALSQAGLSADNLDGAPKKTPVEIPPARPTPPEPENQKPIEIVRGILRDITGKMLTLEKDSGPYVKLASEARQLSKAIAAMELQAAGDETPEERETRLRREDGETTRAIEMYVNQALALALRPTAEAPHGCCPTCGMGLTPEARAELVGRP